MVTAYKLPHWRSRQPNLAGKPVANLYIDLYCESDGISMNIYDDFGPKTRPF